VKKLQIVNKIAKALNQRQKENKRFLVMYGGREAGKGWSTAIYILLLCYYEPIRVLCCREVQKSIKESSYQLFRDRIESEPALSGFFTFKQDKIVGANGSEILFTGLLTHTIDSIKSFERINICWIDEAQKISKRSFEILEPTVRAVDSYFIMTMNPEFAEDYIYSHYVICERTDTVKCKVLFTDNPFRNAATETNRLWLKENAYGDYCHVWLGEPTSNTEASVFKGKWEVVDDLPCYNESKKYYGIDWGFAVDPTVLIECYIHDGYLYISDCIYKYDLKIKNYNDTFAEMTNAIDKVVICDNARPELIDQLKQEKWRAVSCKKWKGCVEDGITYIRQNFKKVRILQKLTDVVTEFKLYAYKTNKNGEVTSDIIDDHNHAIDSIRYALEGLILRAKQTRGRVTNWQ